LNREALTFNH